MGREYVLKRADDPLATAKKELQNIVDTLQANGDLQKARGMVRSALIKIDQEQNNSEAKSLLRKALVALDSETDVLSKLQNLVGTQTTQNETKKEEPTNPFIEPFKTELGGEMKDWISKWTYAFNHIKKPTNRAEELTLQIFGHFMNMMRDPLNQEHLGRLNTKIDEFNANFSNSPENQKKEYQNAYNYLRTLLGGDSFSENKTYDGDGNQSVFGKMKGLGNNIATVRLNVAILDNTAPFIDWEKVKKAKSASELTGYNRTYFEARSMLNQYKDIYQIVSFAYAGTDILDANERILSNTWEGKGKPKGYNFLKERQEFIADPLLRSSIILSMNLREQNAFFAFTKPELVKAGHWDSAGIRKLEANILKLDSSLGFDGSQNVFEKPFSIAAFEADYKNPNVTAGGIATLYIEVRENGQTLRKPITGQVTFSGNTITIGEVGSPLLTIDTSAGTVKLADGTIYDISVIKSYVSISSDFSQNDIKVNQTLQSAKTAGFFQHGMKVIAHYPIDSWDKIFDAINASMDMIITGWSTPIAGENVALTDMTGARNAIRQFNAALPNYLLVSNARKLAESWKQAVTNTSITATEQEKWGNHIINITNPINSNLISNPLGEVKLSNVPYLYFNPFDSFFISPNNAEQFFSDIRLQIVPDVNIGVPKISRYDYQATAAVMQAIIDAVPAFINKDYPHLYWSATDFGHISSYAKQVVNGGVVSDRTFTNTYLNTHWGVYSLLSTSYQTLNQSGQQQAYATLNAYNMGPVEQQEGSAAYRDKRLYYAQEYLRTQMPNNDKAAIYLYKNEKSGVQPTYSMRMGFRSADGSFKWTTVADDMDRGKASEVMSSLQYGKGQFGTDFLVDFQAPESKQEWMDKIGSKDFAGFMVSFNVSDTGFAAFDKRFTNKELSNSFYSYYSGFKDTGYLLVDLMQRVIIPTTSADERKQAVSLFHNFTGIKAGLYADVMFEKKVTGRKQVNNSPTIVTSEGESTLSEVAVKFIRDDKYFMELAADRVKPDKKKFDAYVFDGGVKFGDYIARGTILSGSYSSLPSSFYALGQQSYTGVNYFEGTVSNQEAAVRRAMQFKLLYNTEGGLLWTYAGSTKSQGLVGRNVSVVYDNLLNIQKTSFRAVENYAKTDQFYNGAYGWIFTDESKKLLPFEYDIQGLGSYKDNQRLYGANVRKLKIGKDGLLSLSTLYGKRFDYIERETKDIFGTGGVLKLGDVLIRLQNTWYGKGDYAGAFGIQYANPDFGSNSFISSLSERKNVGQFSSLKHFMVLDKYQKGRVGVYVFYDQEKGTIDVLPPLNQMTKNELKKISYGGQLFYIDPTGVYTVFAGYQGNEKYGTDMPTQINQYGSLGITYNNVPEKGLKLLEDMGLQRGQVQIQFGRNTTGANTQDLYGFQVNLSFRPFWQSP